jgi:hypothetical protein
MITKCYGVECFNCHKKIVVATYPVANPEDVIDARLPESPIRCDQCGQGSTYVQARLIHFLAPDDKAQ